MKKIVVFLSMVLFITFSFISCEKEEQGKGTVHLSITDAPIDADGITGVFITVTEVHFQSDGDSWKEFPLNDPQAINLLDLQRGVSEMMGTFELEAGTYNQIRFMLDAPVFNAGPQSNPGCYLLMEDETTVDLFVPSGTQTGYKAVGTFDLPANGSVELTADFDARKSVVKAGASGKYLLKPTIRMIVKNQAGQISGQITHIPEGSEIVVYAYEKGMYDESEAAEPEAEGTQFPGAVTSDKADENNFYHLAYLAPGNYDLVIVSTVEGAFVEVLGMIEGIEVKSQETTDVPIDIDAL